MDLACNEADGDQPRKVLTDEFRKAVLEATTNCRKIASDERQTFFDQEIPNIDLAKAHTTAKTDVTSLVSAFRSDLAVARDDAAAAERKAAGELVAAEKAVASAKTTYDSLDQFESEVSAGMVSASEAEEPDITARLKMVKTARENAYKQLLESRSTLARLSA